VVFHHRLVCDLSRVARLQTGREPAGVLGAVLARILGNFFGGGCSSGSSRADWRVGSRRKLVIGVSAAGMTLLVPAAYATSLAGLTACPGDRNLAYAALSTMILNLPADIYPSDSVASVSGLSAPGMASVDRTRRGGGLGVDMVFILAYWR